MTSQLFNAKKMEKFEYRYLLVLLLLGRHGSGLPLGQQEHNSKVGLLTGGIYKLRNAIKEGGGKQFCFDIFVFLGRLSGGSSYEG